MVMSATVPQPPVDWPGRPLSYGEIRERFEQWRRVLLDVDRQSTNVTMSREEILATLDRWLDERLDLRGVTRLPDVWDREWPASVRVKRMSKEML